MSYPASHQINTPEKMGNWRPLLQWLLVLPHYVVLAVLLAISTVVATISWIVIILAGKLPAGLAGFQAMYLRYKHVVQAYAAFLTDKYPSFGMDSSSADPGGAPTAVNFSPALEGRSRLSVLFRPIIEVPAIVYAVLVTVVGSVAALLAFFAVLFTGRWPAGLHRLVAGSLLVDLRFSAYALMLTDQYPPFSLD